MSLGAGTVLPFELFMPFMVRGLIALCSEGLKCHPIEMLDSLITSSAASSTARSLVNSHGV